MKRTLIFAVVLFFLFASVSAITYGTTIWNYQENADSSMISQANEWQYFNYTKPEYALSSLWQIKYSYLNISNLSLGEIIICKNLTIPQDCFSDIISVRFQYNLDNFYTSHVDFQCYLNNNSWNTLESYSWTHFPETISLFFINSINYIEDGNYSSNAGLWRNAGNLQNWTIPQISGIRYGFYEEGMNWQIPIASSSTIYKTLEGTGSGIAIFMNNVKIPLVLFILLLGIIIGITYILYLIKNYLVMNFKIGNK